MPGRECIPPAALTWAPMYIDLLREEIVVLLASGVMSFSLALTLRFLVTFAGNAAAPAPDSGLLFRFTAVLVNESSGGTTELPVSA